MANKKITVNSQKAAEICREILEKRDKYESRMAPRLAKWVEGSALYNGKSWTSGENRKPSICTSELYKAVRAMRNMVHRMLLGQKPWFELSSLDIISYEEPDKLIKAEHYCAQNAELARFDNGLATFLDHLFLYGTAVAKCVYEPVKNSFLGKKQYVTKFKPVSLINVAFGLDSSDVDDSSWVTVTDFKSKTELAKLIVYDEKEQIYDHKGIRAAQAVEECRPKVNTWTQQRLAVQGYTDDYKGALEWIVYHGPLDCYGKADEEFCVEIINGEFIIRMEQYDGLKPILIATTGNIDDPMGNGIIDMHLPLLREIDDLSNALANMVYLAGASMFAKQKSLGEEDSEFMIRQFGLLNLESPMLNPIGPDANNITALAQLLQAKIQQFRQASGATDQLQAIVTGEQTTATAVSLSMNEAVRNLSIFSQLTAHILKGYIKLVLQNAQKYNTEPQIVNIGGMPMTVLPSDLLIDTNVTIKTTTDQDFRPTKLVRLREGIQLMSMFPPNAIPGKKMNPGPALMEYLKTLDVPRWQESVQDITEQDMLMSAMAQQMGMGGQAQPAEITESPEPSGTVTTPVGPVLSAPGDAQTTNKAIRQSTAS